MSVRSVGVGTLLLLAALAAGCKGSAARADAGLAPQDAAAPPDAGADARPPQTDTGAKEAAPFVEPCDNIPAVADAVPVGYPAGATRVAGLPAEVEFFEISPPSEPLVWNDCGVGCKELATPWAVGVTGPLIRTSVGGVVDGSPWLMLQQRLPGLLVRTWLGPADGSAQRAFIEGEVTGTRDTGFSYPRVVSSDGYILAVSYHDQLGLAFGGSPGGPPVCLVRISSPVFSIQSAAFAQGRWALVGTTMPALTGAWPVVQGQEALVVVPPPAGDQLYLVVGAGPRLVWLGGASSARLWIWDPDAGAQRLLPDSGGSRIDDCSPSSDDQTLAWLRGKGYHLNTDGAYWDSVELMRAPLPTGTIPIDGTVVRAVPLVTGLGGDSLGVVSGDYWAGLSRDGGPISSQYAYLVRLADGQIWRMSNRSGTQYWLKILYLTSTELALLETRIGAYAPVAYTVVRYDLASLGPGEPCCAPSPAPPPAPSARRGFAAPGRAAHRDGQGRRVAAGTGKKPASP